MACGWHALSRQLDDASHRKEKRWQGLACLRRGTDGVLGAIPTGRDAGTALAQTVSRVCLNHIERKCHSPTAGPPMYC
jgi:hypothetical protein